MRFHLTHPLIFLGLAISCFITSALLVKHYDVKGVSTQEQCQKENEKLVLEGKGLCTIWDGSQCRQGEIKGFGCTAKGHLLPAVFGLLGMIFLVAMVVQLIRKKW